MITIEDNPFHNFFQNHTPKPFESSRCICYFHFILNIQILFVVIDEVTGYGFDQLLILIFCGKCFNNGALQKLSGLAYNIPKVFLIKIFLVILLLQQSQS